MIGGVEVVSDFVPEPWWCNVPDPTDSRPTDPSDEALQLLPNKLGVAKPLICASA